jgi:hypothetical protein
MMGERLMMQESLFLSAGSKITSRPITCCGASIASSTAQSCASIWPASTVPWAGPPLIPSW